MIFARGLLTNDEIFGLMVDLGRNIYQLEEYPKNLNYYILWFPDKNHYAMSIDTTEYDTQSNISLDIRLSVEQDEYLKYPYPDYISTIELNGSLDALSDSPRLLSKLIEYNSNIKYDEKREVLKVTLNTETVNSVNALLKKPFFEIRCLSIEEIFKIEKQLNSTYPKPISGN